MPTPTRSSTLRSTCLTSWEPLTNSSISPWCTHPASTAGRRWKKAVRLIKASAFFNGRDEVAPLDLLLFKDCLWHDEASRTALLEMIGEFSRLYGYQQLVLTRELLALRERFKQLKGAVAQRGKAAQCDHNAADEDGGAGAVPAQLVLARPLHAHGAPGGARDERCIGSGIIDAPRAIVGGVAYYIGTKRYHTEVMVLDGETMNLCRSKKVRTLVENAHTWHTGRRYVVDAIAYREALPEADPLRAELPALRAKLAAGDASKPTFIAAVNYEIPQIPCLTVAEVLATRTEEE